MKSSMKSMLAALAVVLLAGVAAYADQETFGRGYNADEADRLIREINSGQREGWRNASKLQDPNRAGSFDVLAERGQAAGQANFRVKISWKNGADVDLHVTESDGTKVWYKRMKAGGTLHGDDTDGGSPDRPASEVYQIIGGKAGNYKIEVNLFALRTAAAGTTEVTVEITHNPGTASERTEPAIVVPLNGVGQTREVKTLPF